MQQLKVHAMGNSRCSGWGLTEALVALGNNAVVRDMRIIEGV